MLCTTAVVESGGNLGNSGKNSGTAILAEYDILITYVWIYV